MHISVLNVCSRQSGPRETVRWFRLVLNSGMIGKGGRFTISKYFKIFQTAIREHYSRKFMCFHIVIEPIISPNVCRRMSEKNDSLKWEAFEYRYILIPYTNMSSNISVNCTCIEQTCSIRQSGSTVVVRGFRDFSILNGKLEKLGAQHFEVFPKTSTWRTNQCILYNSTTL